MSDEDITAVEATDADAPALEPVSDENGNPVGPAPEATPVLQQEPSNEPEANEPEAVVEAPARPIEVVAAELLAILDEGHKLGDRALDAARDELRAILGA